MISIIQLIKARKKEPKFKVGDHVIANQRFLSCWPNNTFGVLDGKVYVVEGLVEGTADISGNWGLRVVIAGLNGSFTQDSWDMAPDQPKPFGFSLDSAS